MRPFRLLIATLVTFVFVLGCASFSGTLMQFQTYEGRQECVRCPPQEYWGYIERTRTRNDEKAFIGDFRFKNSNINGEWAALCYGIAKSTIKSGHTHFRILDREKWTRYVYRSTSPSVSMNLTERYPGSFTGSGTISEGTTKHDADGDWRHRYYFQKGSPNCADPKVTCSVRHEVAIAECPYSGDELRSFTEGKVSLRDQANRQKGRILTACVMKNDPTLMLEDAYAVMRSCGFDSDGWHLASDALKKFAPLIDDRDK